MMQKQAKLNHFMVDNHNRITSKVNLYYKSRVRWSVTVTTLGNLC